MKSSLLLLILNILFFSLQAQSDAPAGRQEKAANKYFKEENFNAALPLYLALLNKKSDDVHFLLRTGICYLRTNIDKGKATSYFSKLLKYPQSDPEVYLLAGTASQFAYDFDQAVLHYLRYLKEIKPSEEKVELVKRKIESCENAKELMKFPLYVSFENLGKNVNTETADYSPFVPLEESFMLFNSRRKNNVHEPNETGYYASDVYISYVRKGVFQPARLLSESLNTPIGNEDVVGLSGDGKKALFFLDNEDHGNIYTGTIHGDQVDSLEPLPASINAEGSIEAAASLSADGRTIYFASDRTGGFGGFDLYVSRLLPTMEWSEPENLGPAVNSEYNEDFPNISPDGKTLYFSSKGHTSMGGYDIFTASRKKETDRWKVVKNIGVPINTPDDNMNFRVSATGRYGYLSAVRQDGKGDMDLYRVTFHDVAPRFTVIKGNIFTTHLEKVTTDIFITVEQAGTLEPYGDYQPNPFTGRYIIILPPGKYIMRVTSEGVGSFTEYLEVLDKSSFTAEIEKNIILKK